MTTTALACCIPPARLARALLLLPLLGALLWWAAPAAAQTVYRCTTAAGVSFQDAPCAAAAAGGPIAVSAPNLLQADHLGMARVQQADAVRRARENGTLLPGMGAQDVLKTWGAPTSVNTDVLADGTTLHQLVYRDGHGARRYVYLRDGAVTSYQIRQRPR